MKKVTFTLAIVLLSSFFALAQNSGKGFNYQAVARDLNGQVLQNQTIILRFSLIPGQYASDPTWQEMQLANSDEFGAFSLIVGHGQRTGGTVANYADINYGTADYWLKVELKDGTEFFEISFRELLSVPYAEVARNAMPNPVGTILPFAGPTNQIPDGYLLCNGASVDKNAYPELYAVIGNAWGGNTANFNLPDCRGMFLRGVASGSGNDPDRASRTASATGGNTGDNVGSKQTSQFGSHNHTTGSSGNHQHTGELQQYYNGQWQKLTKKTGESGVTHPGVDSGDDDNLDLRVLTNTTGAHTHTISNTGGNETRPINVYVNYIIKY